MEEVGLAAATDAAKAVAGVVPLREGAVVVPHVVGAASAGQGVPRKTVHPTYGGLVAATPAALVACVRGDADHAEAAAGDAAGAVAEVPEEGVVRAARVAVAALGLDTANATAAVRNAALRAVGQAKGGAPRVDTLLRADPPSVVADGVEAARRALPVPDVGGGAP